MRIVLICLISFLVAIPHLVSASDDNITIIQTTKNILSLGKKIDTNSISPASEKIFLERNLLLQKLQESFERIDTRILKKPTLDISRRYNFILQKYSLSCEIAALKMILEVIKGIPISEDQILSGIPISPGPLSRENIWGDPDREFVGSYTGSQRLFTGYGIYERPLASYLRREKIESIISNRFDGRNLAPKERMRESLEHLYSGSLIILWGDWCTTPRHEDGLVEKIDNFLAKKIYLPAKNPCYRDAQYRKLSWTTPEGKKINGLSGEHAFLLLGYIGNIDRPTHIIVWDTDTGRHIYPYTEWMRKWNLMDYRTLMVPDKDIAGI